MQYHAHRNRDTASQKIYTHIFQIDDVDYIVIAQQISVMPAKAIGASVADFSAQQHIIVSAVDCVLSGL